MEKTTSYTLKIIKNGPGFKEFTVEVTQRNRGVIYESHDNILIRALSVSISFINEDFNFNRRHATLT